MTIGLLHSGPSRDLGDTLIPLIVKQELSKVADDLVEYSWSTQAEEFGLIPWDGSSPSDIEGLLVLGGSLFSPPIIDQLVLPKALPPVFIWGGGDFFDLTIPQFSLANEWVKRADQVYLHSWSGVAWPDKTLWGGHPLFTLPRRKNHDPTKLAVSLHSSGGHHGWAQYLMDEFLWLWGEELNAVNLIPTDFGLYSSELGYDFPEYLDPVSQLIQLMDSAWAVSSKLETLITMLSQGRPALAVVLDKDVKDLYGLLGLSSLCVYPEIHHNGHITIDTVGARKQIQHLRNSYGHYCETISRNAVWQKREAQATMTQLKAWVEGLR
jgi:hypothetical protein